MEIEITRRVDDDGNLRISGYGYVDAEEYEEHLGGVEVWDKRGNHNRPIGEVTDTSMEDGEIKATIRFSDDVNIPDHDHAFGSEKYDKDTG